MTSLERTLTLTVPSATENLALIREFVANVGSQAGLGDDDVAKLELAVDEACANVIEHAHGHDSDKEVTVRATFDAATLRIEVVDEGQGFDPTAVPSTPVEQMVHDRRTGGLGTSGDEVADGRGLLRNRPRRAQSPPSPQAHTEVTSVAHVSVSRLESLLESAQLLHASLNLDNLLKHLLRTVMGRLLVTRAVIAIDAAGGCASPWRVGSSRRQWDRDSTLRAPTRSACLNTSIGTAPAVGLLATASRRARPWTMKSAHSSRRCWASPPPASATPTPTRRRRG